MTALADACRDLARALPQAQALTTIPDTTPTTGRTRPASRPPWNPAAAAALLDALEGARQLEAAWRNRPRRPMAHTGATLASIVRLGAALPDCPPRAYDQQNRPLPCHCERCEAVRSVRRWELAILQLAAIDLQERAVKLAAVCPYCGNPVLLARMREGLVACPRGGSVCADSDGNPPKGQMGYSRLDGTPQTEWNDGLVT